MMTADQSFSGNSSDNLTDYTSFISDVGNNQVGQVRFNENELLVTKTDGSKYSTVMPNL